VSPSLPPSPPHSADRYMGRLLFVAAGFSPPFPPGKMSAPPSVPVLGVFSDTLFNSPPAPLPSSLSDVRRTSTLFLLRIALVKLEFLDSFFFFRRANFSGFLLFFTPLLIRREKILIAGASWRSCDKRGVYPLFDTPPRGAFPLPFGTWAV